MLLNFHLINNFKTSSKINLKSKKFGKVNLKVKISNKKCKIKEKCNNRKRKELNSNN